MGGALAGASLLELARYRAAWAQSITPTAGADLFDIEKVTDDIYFARAKPAAIGNSNAAIFVNSGDVVVVDAHSKPSAAASLIAQIKKEVTPKPVRYLVNTHFHWDHSQGNAAYAGIGAKVVASKTTRQLMSENIVQRLRATVDPDGHGFPGQPRVPVLLDAARERLAKATSTEEKALAQDRIRQLEAFAVEMKGFSPTLPTVTFNKSYVINDKAHDIHLEFHGRAHTAGDIVIFCPQKRVIATGDIILGQTPFIQDGYPKAWPKTIDSAAKLDFDRIMPGHGGVQNGRQRMNNLRNYVEELTQRVEDGKKAGRSAMDLQKIITVASLKSLNSDGYAEFLVGPGDNPSQATILQSRVNNNIEQIYNRLDVV
jgi:glyoxylase-like metal-dependent hydrolase (beta-lactamase superfamily II)